MATRVPGRPDDIIEKSDCSVRAMVIASGLPYIAVHAAAARVGRKVGRAMRTAHIGDFVREITRRHGIAIHKLRLGRRTLSTFCRMYPQGSYFISIRGHLLAVVDGKITDNTKPGCIVKDVWRIG